MDDYYVADVYGRTYFGGKRFATRDEAWQAASLLSRGERYFGVYIIRPTAATTVTNYRELIFAPQQDM